MLDKMTMNITGADWLADSQRQIEACLPQLLDRVAAGSPLLPAMRDALLGPGKRLRPLLTLASFAYAGGDVASSTIIEVACAFELLHAASLIYDDLPCMDDATVRRGHAPLHVAHGEATALLAAIALMNGAYAAATPIALSPDIAVQLTRLLAETVGATGLAAGQYHDLNQRPAIALQPTQVRHLKTGILFSAAAQAGALCAHADAHSLTSLGRYADALGTAFQLLDDLDDHDAPEDEARLQAVLGQQVQAARAALDADSARAAPLRQLLDLIFGG